MRTLVVPYGEEGWQARQRVLEDVLSQRQAPPFLYNDILVLVPSARLKRTYGKFFLDLIERFHGAHALSQPEVQTLSQFLQRLASRAGTARLIDETGRLVLLEGLVKERISGNGSFGRSADLLAPALSAAVADMIEELSSGEVTPERLAEAVAGSDVAEKPQVRLLVEVYGSYEQALADRDLVDPAGMARALADRFDPAWIAEYRSVIIDGIHDATGHPAEVLQAVARLGSSVLIVDAPFPEAVADAGPSHPLRLLREFLERIGPLSFEQAAPADRDARFLAEALFSERSFDEAARQAPSPAEFRKDLRLCSAVNARDEVSFIAGEVKRSLARGTPPDAVLVTFPSLDEYGPLAEEIFSDYGIPYNRALGRQLSTSPVATAVVALLQACQDDLAGPSLLRVFGSPFLKFAEQSSLAPVMDRFLRSSRITGGREKVLAALARRRPDHGGEDILTGPFTDLAGALEPFSSPGPAPLSRWMDRLARLIAWSDLGARVALIKGPLNINLQAYRKLADTLASLRSAGSLFPEYRYTFSEWLFLLKKTFMHVRFQVPPDDEGGVQVLGMEESVGHPWQEVYLGGLTDGAFPQRMPQNIFLPEATLETLGVRTLEHGRLAASFHFYRLLLSAPKVVLTRPENVGDRPAVPSPFLEELAPLRTADLLDERRGLQFSFKLEDCGSAPELAKALALAGKVTGLDAVLRSGLAGTPGIAAALAFRPPAQTGLPAPVAKREFRVTELDSYLRCPYDYYIEHVLGVAPLEEVSEDISPMDRGSKVHSVLREFYRSWDRPVTDANRTEAAELLRRLAEEAFATEADTFRNRREKELFITVMAERFLDAETLFWQQSMRPACLEEKIDDLPFTLADGTEVLLNAKIDRIDLDPDGNFIIVDYKTGKYPEPRKGIDQEIFQLPVYAVMARQALSVREPLLKRPIGLAYYDLSGRMGGLCRDVVLFDREARNDHPSTKPQCSPKSTAEFEQVLAASMDKARKAIEGILRGEFPMTPMDEKHCRFCQNEEMCRDEET